MKREERKILLISGDRKVSSELSRSLKAEGYMVSTSENGFDAITLAERELPDLIITEFKAPRINGVETVRIIRKISGLHHIRSYFFIDDISDQELVPELRMMAEDYFACPVNLASVIRSVNMLFERHRRNGENAANGSKGAGGLWVDRETYLVHYQGKTLDFPKKEFELIHLLASCPEKVFSRKEIFRTVWNKELSSKGARTIDVHIRKLREKLEGLNIMTIKGVGYKLSIRLPLTS